jgi:hypothetical protein
MPYTPEAQTVVHKLEQIVTLIRAASISLDCEEDGPDITHLLEVAESMLDDVISAARGG